MKIMFVCTGNICRSAMAHWLMKKRLKDEKIEDVEVYSCGTFAQENDFAMEETKESMKEYGVNMENHRATPLFKANIEEMDLIFCMTNSQKQMIQLKYPNKKDNIYTLKEYVALEENIEDLDISDPWGYDITTYRFCAAQISSCIEELLKKLNKK